MHGYLVVALELVDVGPEVGDGLLDLAQGDQLVLELALCRVLSRERVEL